MGKSFSIVFAAALLLMTAACTREAPTGLATLGLDTLLITGTVVDFDNGRPLAAITVTAAGLKTTTDISGRYDLRFDAENNDLTTSRPLVRFSGDKHFGFDTMIVVEQSRQRVDAKLVYAAPGIGELQILPVSPFPGSAVTAYISRVEVFDRQGNSDIDSVWAYGYYKRPHIPSRPMRWLMQRVSNLADSSALFETEMPALIDSIGNFEPDRHKIEVRDRSGFRETRLYIFQGK